MRTIVGISLLLALAVAGCGSSASTSGPGGATTGAGGATTGAGASQITSGNMPDPCTLLSKAEIESAYGMPVQDGVPDISHSCKWDSTPGSVSLHFLAIAGTTCAAANQSKTQVTDLGVPASWHYIPAGTTGSVVACTSGLQVQIVLVGDIVNKTPPEATLRDEAVQLMRLVLGRLQPGV